MRPLPGQQTNFLIQRSWAIIQILLGAIFCLVSANAVALVKGGLPEPSVAFLLHIKSDPCLRTYIFGLILFVQGY